MANLLTELPETEPAFFVSGDTLQWLRIDLGVDYSNATHTLAYIARKEGAGSTTFTISATNDGANYKAAATAAATAAYTVGKYRWDAYITKTSNSARVRVDSGTWEVKPNLASATTDPRSHAKIMLDKIELLLEGRADADVASYSIAGRSLTKMSQRDLMVWRDRYKAEYLREVKKERIANGEASGSQIKVRFG